MFPRLALAALAAAAAVAAPRADTTAPAPAAAPAAPQPAPGSPPPPAAAAPAPAEDGRAAIAKAFARELPPLPRVEFRTPGGLEGSVEAKAAPAVEKNEKSETLSIDLGTEMAVSCTVVPSRLDSASLVRSYVDGVKERVPLVAVRPVAIVVAAASPLVFVELVYAKDSPEGKRVGHVQLGVYAHPARSFLCEHDEPGYEKTFQRVVTGLAASLVGGGDGDERPGARFREIHVTRLGDVPVGYTEHVVWERQGGGRVANTWSSQLLPRSPTELVAEDGWSEELTDAKGLLDEGSYANASNGEVNARTRIERAADRLTYSYRGEVAGEKLAGKFKTKAGLATDLWFASRFDKARAYGPKAEVRAQGYELDANPAGAIDVAYRKDPSRPRGVTVSLGPATLVGVLDDAGLVADAEMPVGGAKLRIERVFVHGAP